MMLPPSAPRSAQMSWLAVLAVVAATGVTLSVGCAPAPPGDAASPAASTPPPLTTSARDAPTPAPEAAPRPVVLPDLSQLEESVQEQIRARHASLLRKAADERTPPVELGNAYGEVGSILRAAGYRDAAEAAYQNAHALAPGVMRWPYYLGHLYRQEGAREKAAAFFERALELDPVNVPALTWLGEMYLDQGRPAEAERVFDQVLAREPDSAAAWSGVGRAALAREDAARAVASLERALSLEPAASSLHYSLGMAYRALGELDEAEEHLRQRGPSAPALPDPLLQESGGLLRSTLAYETRGMREMDAGRFAEAAAIFREGLQTAPDHPQLRHRLGAALMFAGDSRGAEQEFEAVLRLAPDFERAHFNLGVLLSMRGRHREAIDRYAAAVEHQANYLEARLGLAEALRVTGRLEESVTQFERVVEIDPAFAEAWMARAVTLVQLARHREARDWLQRALLIHPGHPDFTDLLARILTAAPDDRVRDGGRAMALMQARLGDPPSIEMQETMAMVLAEVGRYAEAVTWQRRAIAGAEQTGQVARVRFMAGNLAFYEQGRPCRVPLDPLPPPPVRGQRPPGP